MEASEREKYLKAYYENEANANKQMSIANAFSALAVFIIFILYLVGFFPVHDVVLTVIKIVFPIVILILLTPLAYLIFFKERLNKRGYKYFVIFSFVFVIATLNIVIPKHGILGWALAILVVNHYYNPKLGTITYSAVMVLMLLCLYGGMFLGEYDPNLLGGGLIVNGDIKYIDGIKERYDMLHQLLVEGENRYLKVFLYYYVSRGVILTLIFLVSNSLNRRTYNLLVKEIIVSNEQSRTKTELEVAKDIQIATLPVEFITNKDVEIQAELRAAKEVGGDFYDYFVLDEDHIAIVIGDVSGKGIPAAMFMMKTITCFKNYISISRTPAEVLRLVNKTIHEGNESNMFVTCFLAIINTKNGEMKFANAGHNPPIVGKFGSYRYLKCKTGFILGGFENAFVTDEVTTLQNGETITLYTDGITEAMNPAREQYGEKRLLDLFNKKEYSCLVELHRDLKDEVEKFVDGAEQSDDMTYLTLKYHGDKYEYEEAIFQAKHENIQQMLDFLKKFSEKHHIEEGFADNLQVVSDELLSNVVKYGYKEGQDGTIFLRALYNLDKKELVLTIIDEGEEFNPFLVNASPLEGDVSSRKVGGLGILIVKKLMSEYAYDRIYNKNIVTLKKKF